MLEAKWEDGSPQPQSEIEARVGRLESQVADLNSALAQVEQRMSAAAGG
jgi:outer membrane murein-binding lipoprotein Lpp